MDSKPLAARSRAPLSRRGFTLVELLVVIAIIGILVALLLPAIQSAREAGRRNDCKNRLRQFGLAAQNHLSTHKHYPTGGLGWHNAGDPNLGFGAKQPAAWTYSILPYIEYGAVHDQGKNLPATQKQAAIRAAIETVIPLYFCPSRRSPQTVPFTHGQNYLQCGGTKPTVVARNDYIACAGSDGSGNQPTNITPAAAENDLALSKNGITLCGMEVRIKGISDGTSKTLLYGEKALNSRTVETTDSDNDQGWNLGFDWDVIRWTNLTPLPDAFADQSTWDSKQGYHRFGSGHTYGMQCVMADASVQWLSYEINQPTFRILGSRNDGKLLPDNWDK